MKEILAPSVTQRDPKGLKLMTIVGSAYDKAKLSEEEAQRVNEAPGLSDLVDQFIAENRQPNQFADEEVLSKYTYPKEYKGAKQIEEQIAAVAKIFGLDPASALEFIKNLPELPDGAEGWFAVPSVDALAAKHFPEVTDPAEKYCRAVQLIHKKLADSRPFFNYRDNQITPDRLRVHTRTVQMLSTIAETQKGDILVVAAQLGMRHRGESVRRARVVFAPNEFGLNSLMVGSIVLTHPERLVRWEELDMDCAGDDFAFDVPGRFDGAPYFFFFYGDGVGFDANGVSDAYVGYGSVSGFLPQ